MNETTNPTPNHCNVCDSNNVIKYGKYKDTQYYLCKDCGRRFSGSGRIPKMWNTTKTVADAVNMYYEGMSLAEIRRNLIQQDGNYLSRITPYKWVHRFTEHAIEETRKHKPNVGSIWVADETVTDLDGKNVWFWDMIDTKTSFIVATHMSYTRTLKMLKN